MRRRVLLASLTGSVLPGCTSTVSPRFHSGSARSYGPDVTVERVSIDDAAGLSATAEVLRRPGPESPLELSITVQNDGSGVHSFGTGPSPPFDPSLAQHPDLDAALFLVPADGTGFQISDGSAADIQTDPRADEVIPGTPADGCWRAGTSSLQAYLMARGATLHPGESLERTYLVLAHPENDECAPPGTYRFTDRVSIDDRDAAFEVVVRRSA